MTDNNKKTQKEQQGEQEPQESTQSREKSEESEKKDRPDGQQDQQLLEEPIKVKDYIYLNILTLEGKAWAYLDLIAHPETQKHQKDMEQAKLAIDSIDALFKQLEPHLTDEQKKDLQTRLTNLHLNFVK